MAAPSRPRFGSLQFWPRKRSEKQIPSVNWAPILAKSPEQGILGFLAYKAAMATVSVKDNTADSMTKGKKIILPVTVLEVPNMKLLSIRVHKNKQVSGEVILSNDKELKRIITTPKAVKTIESLPKDFDDVTVIAYTLVSQTAIKKTPDMIELGISAPNAQAKLEIAKSFIGKEISIKDFVGKKDLVDVRGLTKGKGFSGPMERFGISKKAHKSEKGVRRPGSLGPWHPHHVIFRVPQAGQVGMFSRVSYNQKIIFTSNIKEKNINPVQGFKHFGNVKGNYILVKGSVHGPVKRAVLLTAPFRPSKERTKDKFEFVEVLQ